MRYYFRLKYELESKNKKEEAVLTDIIEEAVEHEGAITGSNVLPEQVITVAVNTDNIIISISPIAFQAAFYRKLRTNPYLSIA